MKKCLRCNEIIDDELEVCPNCHTEFTPEQLKEMRKAVESEEVQRLIREKEKLIRFHKKRVIMGSIMFSGIGITIISPLLFMYNTTLGLAVLFSGLAIAIGGLIFGFISGATNCPYCNGLLFRNYGNHCAYCGKKYR